MPKPTKLHSKGKVVSMQKPIIQKKEELPDTDQENAMRQFQLELCWCIQQLERNLCDKKATEKQVQETWKVLQVLKNNNQPIIRKRQLMRSHFGDYRAKMLAEEKKLAKMTSKMKISEKAENPRATFLRKSVFLATGDSPFKFNFNVEPDMSNNTTNNMLSEQPGNTVQSSGDGNTEVQAVKDNSRTFTFMPQGTEFKFNFDVNNV